MEANTISIIGVLKWLFPSLIGSCLAVWYKRDDIDWQSKTKQEKILYSLLGLGSILVGVVFGWTIAQVIITYAEINEFSYQFAIYLVSSLSSLKVLDAIVQNTDDILTLFVDGIKSVVKRIVDKLTGGK